MRASKEPNRIPSAKRIRIPGALAFAAAAVIALASFAIPGAPSLALGFLEAFEAQRVVPLALTPEDLRQLKFLPNFEEFGTSRQLTHDARTLQTTDYAQAASWSGLALRTPTYLPAGVARTTANMVMPVSVGAFTFDRRKAAATARAHGYALPPMPPGLDGSTLQIAFGPTVVTAVGDDARTSAGAPAAADGSTPQPKSPTPLSFSAHGASLTKPAVIILQSATPKITSTGASAATIEDYLLAQPGISPRLAAAIHALGNPATTLPIPIPLGSAYEFAVTVHGLPGVAIGDNTGIGAVVIWQERGLITAVAGTLPVAEIGRIAESMR